MPVSSAPATTLQALVSGIQLVDDGDVIESVHHNSLRAAIELIANSLPKIAAGQSDPGVGWQLYPEGDGISIDVDTNAAGFTATPTYIISLGGVHSHWGLDGGSSVYNPTPTGFRVYVRWASWVTAPAVTPTKANELGWHVKWIGIQ